MGTKAESLDGARPDKLTLAAGFLLMLQMRSTCKRAQVAALVCDPDLRQIHALGYNGPARGEKNDSCRDEQGNCGCVHAEANALVKLRTTERGLILFSTTAPCELCARLIVNCGAIKGVVYLENYRSTLGLDVLKNAGLEVGTLEVYTPAPHSSRYFQWPDYQYKVRE